MGGMGRRRRLTIARVGVFFVLYLVCVNVLVRRRGDESIQWIPLSTASILFTLSTLHIGLQLRKLYEGMVQHAHTPGGPDAYFLGKSPDFLF